MRLLLTSAGIKNTSIHDALVDLLAGKPSTVMTGALDRPDTSSVRVLLGESKRLRVAGAGGRHPPLRHHCPGPRLDDSERVLVAVRVDPDHVVHHLCNHPDRSSGFARRVQ